jgi:hypothetical protein
MANLILTKIQNSSERVVVDHDLDAVDAKGKKIGVRVTTREVDLVEVASGEGGCYYRAAPGRRYTARIQKTKDGKPWGATQPERFYETEEKRDAVVEERLRHAQAMADLA